MDTIIILRRMTGGDLSAYAIKAFPLQNYQVVQVELGEVFLERKAETSLLARLRETRQDKQREKLAVNLRSELSPLLDELGDNYYTAAGGLLKNDAVQRLLPLSVFEGYLEKKWVRRLLSFAVHSHFVVLGTAAYLPELLCELAPRMKSLLWMLPDYFHAEMLDDFAEDFYQEYGLAINLRFLGFNGSYGQLRAEKGRFREPVNVLDFTEERHVPRIELESGSVWLDMASVAEKEQRLEAGRAKISYISLKKQWEHPQKAAYLLDTV